MLLFNVALMSETVAMIPSNYNSENAGTEDNPFLIETLANLRWLSETKKYWGSPFYNDWKSTKHYFIQTADIDASETIDWNDGHGFIPIGASTPLDSPLHQRYFYGVFDGNGYSIYNLHISVRPEIRENGMFGEVARSTIKNIRLVDLNYMIDLDAINCRIIGGLIGSMSHSNVQNVSTTGHILLKNKSQNLMVGGLVGHSNFSFIERSYSYTNITEKYIAMQNGSIGGLVGTMHFTSLNNSFYFGQLSLMQERIRTGGLIGTAHSSDIRKNYVAGSDAFNKVISVVGLVGSSIIKSCIWDIETTGITDLYNQEWIVEGLDGNTFYQNHGHNTGDMKKEDTYIAIGWDFEDVWFIDPIINAGYPYLLSIQIPPITTGSIIGVVTINDGVALEGVHVTLSGTNIYAYTDVKGFYYLPSVPIGMYHLIASKDGFLPYTSPLIIVVANEVIEFDIELIPFQPPTGVLAVQVVTHIHEGGAIEGVKITVVGTEFIAYTDEAGWVYFYEIPVGTYTIQASKEGFYNFTSPKISILNNEVKAVQIILRQMQIFSIVGTIEFILPPIQTKFESVKVQLEKKKFYVVPDSTGVFGFPPVDEGFDNIIVYLDGLEVYRSDLFEIVSGKTIEHNIVINNVSDADAIDGPIVSALHGNFPNPFNPSTTIQFSVGAMSSSLVYSGHGDMSLTQYVRINVYNVRGQLINTLVDGVKDIGTHSVVWNGTDHYGNRVASGVYFYRLETNAGSEVRHMMLMK